MKTRNKLFYAKRETATHFEFHVSKDRQRAKSFDSLDFRYAKTAANAKADFEDRANRHIEAYDIKPA